MAQFRFGAANFAEPLKNNNFRVEILKIISPLMSVSRTSAKFFGAGTIWVDLIFMGGPCYLMHYFYSLCNLNETFELFALWQACLKN